MEGCCAPLGRPGSSTNTMWPGPRPTSIPSGILINPTVWPQYANVTDTQDRTDRQRSNRIGRPFFQTVAQKSSLHQWVTYWTNCNNVDENYRWRYYVKSERFVAILAGHLRIHQTSRHTTTFTDCPAASCGYKVELGDSEETTFDYIRFDSIHSFYVSR